MVTMVATDGHRLAVAEIDHKFEGFDSRSSPTCSQKRPADGNTEACERSRRGRRDRIRARREPSFFRAGERLLISRMLTGQFPNYEAVLAA